MIKRFVAPLIALACLVGQARAGLIIEVPTLVIAQPDDSGWFDVNARYVSDSPGPGPEYSVAGFTVNITIGGSGIVFTGADELTSAPYLLDFPGSTNIGLTIADPDPIPFGGTTSLTFFDSTSPLDFP